jgi:hypothetical protein
VPATQSIGTMPGGMSGRKLEYCVCRVLTKGYRLRGWGATSGGRRAYRCGEPLQRSSLAMPIYGRAVYGDGSRIGIATKIERTTTGLLKRQIGSNKFES